MALDSKDRAFRCDAISRIDYKTLAMDRVLTAFLARLWHGGVTSRMRRATDLDVNAYLELLVDDKTGRFDGFADNEDVTRRWVATHLLDLVNRGRVSEAVAGPRPLHGFAYRLRNTFRSRPYGADEQLYELLAVNDIALKALREFFFSDIDPTTGEAVPGPDIDVESQALLSMVEATQGKAQDRAENSSRREQKQLCRQPAELLGEDVLRLLLHRNFMPRTVLVEHLKILLSFHLALYHLRMFKLVPAAVRDGAVDNACVGGYKHDEQCRFRPQLFVDVAGSEGELPAEYAVKSAATWYGRLPQFVRGTFAVLKLTDFAKDLHRQGKYAMPGKGDLAAADAIALLDKKYEADREVFFDMRVRRILDEEEEPLAPELQTIIDLGLSRFDTYLELIMHYRGAFQRKYLVDCLDSMFLKGRPGELLTQPRGSTGVRRFVLDSRLLEVLLQVCLVQPDASGQMRTRPMRVDEVLETLQTRYGLYIDTLPTEDGFHGPDLPDQAAVRANTAAFVDRLREIGYYRDLSDAYLAQTVTPRFTIGAHLERSQSWLPPRSG
ncbi:hypothetical protein CLV30_101104 [Haloactinopolyspora alba]|uniref:Uncharacterized protein n=1 Tax=Haloactinopolyspora alba TaxID=648780 RepID=A0A2P8EF88_9ACTN|nr:hypothetical protein [Haloactinopolyspora alba]PSL08137.1 hypothetical protein CLV30_101104 [Haloactinopolyspora alba]